MINTLTASQRQPCRFLCFMMMVHLYQNDPKRNYSRMNCSACYQPPFGANEIDASINTQMLNKFHDGLVHLVAF